MDERTERFRRVFDACYQPLHAYARRRCVAADAEDLVAEVLAVAWRRLDDVPAEAPLPWLFGVARRCLANQRRGADRRLRLLRRLACEPVAVTWPTASGGDDAVLDTLARLRPDDREVLRLATWEQLAVAEIAVVLGCTPNAAAIRLSRARRRFREQLTQRAGSRTELGRKDADA